MTLALRIALVLVSFLTLLYIIRKIRASKLRLEDSLFWLCFAVLLLVVSIFPGIFYLLSSIVGTMSVSNFVFLFFIFVLLIECFTLSVRVSQLDTKLRNLTQQLAIEKYERYSNDKNMREKSDAVEEEGISSE